MGVVPPYHRDPDGINYAYSLAPGVPTPGEPECSCAAWATDVAQAEGGVLDVCLAFCVALGA